MILVPFDRLSLGEVRTSRGRTVTETDVVHFCMLTGNWLEIHANEEFAKTTRFGKRVVQGTLVFSIVSTLFEFRSEFVEAFYGVDRLRFVKPTFIGDTLTARVEIVALRDRDERCGIVTTHLTGMNQRDETVVACEFSLLVKKSAVSSDAAAPGGAMGALKPSRDSGGTGRKRTT